MIPSLRFLASHPVSFLLSLVFAVTLGYPIKAILDHIRERITVPEPRGLTQGDRNSWAQIADTPGPEGGAWIGGLERMLFLIAFLASLPELIIGWLAFKVATKWEVWTNLYRVPDNLPRINQLDFFLARTRLGARVFQRFMVGTLLNIASGFLAFIIFRWLVTVLPE